MKIKIILVLLFLIGFAIFIVIRFFVLDRQNAVGRLKIDSSPAATVFIDDAALGKTPFDNGELKPGEHKVKLIPEGKETKTVTWEGMVLIYKNSITYISRELGTTELTSAGEVLTISPMNERPNGAVGAVIIESEPAGAIVYLDNDEKGVSPLELKDIPIGDHELSVYLPGFFRRLQKIKIEKGYQVKAIFKMAVDQSHKTLSDAVLEKEKEATLEAEISQAPEEESEVQESTSSATTGKTIEILDNDVGYLNVREEPEVTAKQVARVNPGETYEYTETQNGWYYIVLDDGTEGWVSGDYVTEVE